MVETDERRFCFVIPQLDTGQRRVHPDLANGIEAQVTLNQALVEFGNDRKHLRNGAKLAVAIYVCYGNVIEPGYPLL